MTRFEQIKAAFPEHWCRIHQCMDTRMRNMYLVREADPWGAGSALRGAFHWDSTDEGHAFWRLLSERAKQEVTV